MVFVSRNLGLKLAFLAFCLISYSTAEDQQDLGLIQRSKFFFELIFNIIYNWAMMGTRAQALRKKCVGNQTPSSGGICNFSKWQKVIKLQNVSIRWLDYDKYFLNHISAASL
uniref:Putative secreted protein n=1 Tax=Hemileia vastatrix TaxID=203904 RepID=T1UMY7_9BASI|nr:putative secreted protein [Hemileia vastatrix]